MIRIAIFGIIILALAPATRTQAQVPVRQIDSSYGCVQCHAANRRAFISGVHAERGIRCDDCHQGDPSAFALPAAHRAPFVGSPSKLEVAQLCSTCHSDPSQMRQYGLPTDQLAGLRTSRHGQLLDRGDEAAPTCTDCHEAHLIRRATDARSRTHPTHISQTCVQCHENQELMGRYGLGTDQYAQYRASEHGVALYERGNSAAPSCIGCHGSHAALPPGVTEIADVCGRCHALVRQAFFQGPHGVAATTGAIPGCLGCHANHATTHPSPDPMAAGCLKCHDEGSAAAALGLEFQRGIRAATENIRAAEEAIDELVRAGRDASGVRQRFRTAQTRYRQIAQVQHSLNLDALKDLELRVSSTTGDIVESAEVARERQWEHKLILIPVWFLALAVVVLAAFRRGEVRRQRGEA